jgi:hypothetical protein
MGPEQVHIERLDAWRLATLDVEDTWRAWKLARSGDRRSACRAHMDALAREHEAALALREAAEARAVGPALPLATASP